jgi:hypothetical protein
VADPVRKPTRRIVDGDGAAAYLPFALNKLRQMNMIGGPSVQERTITVGNARIQIKKGLAVDSVYVRTTVGGYILSMRVVTSQSSGNTSPTGESFGTITTRNFLFVAPKPSGPWKPAAIDQIGSSINEDFLMQPWAGEAIQSIPQQDGDGFVKSVFYGTKDLAKSFHRFFDLNDSFKTFAGGHQVKTFVKGSKRGFYFVTGFGAAGTTSLGRYMEGDDTATLTLLPGTWYSLQGGSPIIDLVNPDTVIGLRGDGVPGGVTYFFITRDAGATITTFPTNDLFARYAAAHQGVNARRFSTLHAISDTVALLSTATPENGLTTQDWYRVDFVTGQTTQVLTKVYGSFVNAGNGVLLIQSLANINATADAYTNTLYTSMDNGLTWTTSEASMPQVSVAGPSVNYYATGALSVPLLPYVSADNKGAIYQASNLEFTGPNVGGFTDLRLFVSKDLMRSWQQVATVQKQADYPTDGGLVMAFRSVTLVPVGSPTAPLAIDPILPWRTNSATPAPSYWTRP